MNKPLQNVFRFLPHETSKMEDVLAEYQGDMPPRNVLERLAEEFSQGAERRASNITPQFKQIWNWFMNKRHSLKREKRLNRGGEQQPNQSEENPRFVYEAKSARDGAWYDVERFLGQRILSAGNPEVMVSFTGFGEEENEWVHAARNLRLRSVPCELTDCLAVWPGDLVLCFQEGNEQALYYDADVLDIQRRRHDLRGCRCRFWVRYCHDDSEESVQLRKLCRRPETELRLKAAGVASGSQTFDANKVLTLA